MVSSVLPRFTLVEPQRPKLTSTRHSAFLLATPWLLDGRYFVGLAKAQLGADAEAVIWMRRSLDANRNYSATHFDLAGALARLGRLDEAGFRERGACARSTFHHT